MNNFEVACGTVVGKDHISSGKVLIGRNNQDAFAVKRTDDVLVAIVCDGCGSGKHSEVGAWLGAEMIASTIIDDWGRVKLSRRTGLWRTRILERVRLDTLARIRLQATSMCGFGGSFSKIINDYFLFTVVGVVIDNEGVVVFSIGDGGYAVKLAWSVFADEGLKILGPFPDNAPPYLSYDLVDSSINKSQLKFVIDFFNTDNVKSIIIGSDGIEDLSAAEDKLIPGTKEKVGPLEQLWRDDAYFDKPDALGRKLRRMNSDVVRIDKDTCRRITQPRLLPDDTTIISIRAKGRP